MILQKWKQCGVAVQGKDHIASGTVCQDNVAALAANGVQAIALSDGGGSRKLSHIGSALATKAAVELLTERFDELYDRLMEIKKGGNGSEKALSRLRRSILDRVLAPLYAAVTPEQTMRDFGCTLQLAAVKGDRYLVGHIGDGVIAALSRRATERRIRVLSHPENGGAPNITFFVTDHNAEEHLRLSCGQSDTLEGILMMSDGPEEVLYSPVAGMHPNTRKLFENFGGLMRAEYTAALTKFLQRSIAAHSFDDLSLNLLYLDAADRDSLRPAALEEMLSDITSPAQVTRVSSYAYFLDPTVPPVTEGDLSFLRG